MRYQLVIRVPGSKNRVIESFDATSDSQALGAALQMTRRAQAEILHLGEPGKDAVIQSRDYNPPKGEVIHA